MAFPAFVLFVLWLCDKLEHAQVKEKENSFISTKNSKQACFSE